MQDRRRVKIELLCVLFKQVARGVSMNGAMRYSQKAYSTGMEPISVREPTVTLKALNKIE